MGSFQILLQAERAYCLGMSTCPLVLKSASMLGQNSVVCCCVQEEPTVLPSRFPQLLVNGSQGIAVGIATKIPPHNMREVVAGVLALIDNPDISNQELMQHIPAPDFPTGEQVAGQQQVSGV